MTIPLNDNGHISSSSLIDAKRTRHLGGMGFRITIEKREKGGRGREIEEQKGGRGERERVLKKEWEKWGRDI